MKAVVDVCKEFFNLPMEEKMEFADKDIWKPIRFGTGVDVKVEKFFTWRDFIKVLGVPQFQFPNKPKGFRYKRSYFMLKEYHTKTKVKMV